MEYIQYEKVLQLMEFASPWQRAIVFADQIIEKK